MIERPDQEGFFFLLKIITEPQKHNTSELMKNIVFFFLLLTFNISMCLISLKTAREHLIPIEPFYVRMKTSTALFQVD